VPENAGMPPSPLVMTASISSNVSVLFTNLPPSPDPSAPWHPAQFAA